MKTLVIYDSNFGNTQKIAETIAKELEAQAISVSEVTINELEGTGLLIMGSPIHGWRPSEKMNKFLAKLSAGQLKGVKAATFDTRVKLFIHGDAAKKIAKALENAGAEIIIEPQPFFVKGKKGPLFDGEIEKALTFAKEIRTKYESISKTD
jgi:flavodoxin